jgi:RNA polymerase sigma factor (sigma-70 family)
MSGAFEEEHGCAVQSGTTALLDLLQEIARDTTRCRRAEHTHLLVAEIGRFRGMIRGIVKGELADENAILNCAALAICGAASAFRGSSVGEAIAFCARTVRVKTIDYVRQQHGWLQYVGCPQGEPAAADGDREERGEVDGSRTDTPEKLALDAERCRLLRHALDTLSPAERYVIERVELQGARIVDVAAELGERNNTISQRLIRSKRKLRTALAPLLADAGNR